MHVNDPIDASHLELFPKDFGERLARLSERPEPCTHTWGEPVHVSFSPGDHAVLRICETCQGFVRRCKRCRRFHMVFQGLGGEYAMPWWVSEAWLTERGC